MPSFTRVRASRDEDVPAITRIYGYHVLNGTASFELEAPDEAEIRLRRAAIRDRHLPYLVAEDENGVVLGYAYASAYRPRPAYGKTVENSIYVDVAHSGKGLGRLLLTELIAQCDALGMREMVAVIGDSANRASIALHERAGFRMVGTLENVGFKFGRWLDTVLMQRPLGPRP